MIQDLKPARRIVTIDKEPGKSCLVSDGPAPDVRFDPARPGYASARLWVAEGTPAPIVPETLHLPHTIEPPQGRLGLPRRHLPAGRGVGRQGRREGSRRLLQRDGLAGCIDLSRRRRRIPTCRRRARSISASSSKARSCWCSTRRKCSSRRAIS